MSVQLLDVNVLVSLLDSAHVHHEVTARWFRGAVGKGWASCPLTENGFLRVVSHVSYPNLRLTPGLAAESLRRLKENFSAGYHFWPDTVSLTDKALFDLGALSGTRQTTDAYLAGLAFHNGGRLATMDKSIPWRAVKGADAKLLERIGA